MLTLTARSYIRQTGTGMDRSLGIFIELTGPKLTGVYDVYVYSGGKWDAAGWLWGTLGSDWTRKYNGLIDLFGSRPGQDIKLVFFRLAKRPHQ